MCFEAHSLRHEREDYNFEYASDDDIAIVNDSDVETDSDTDGSLIITQDAYIEEGGTIDDVMNDPEADSVVARAIASELDTIGDDNVDADLVIARAVIRAIEDVD